MASGDTGRPSQNLRPEPPGQRKGESSSWQPGDKHELNLFDSMTKQSKYNFRNWLKEILVLMFISEITAAEIF